MNKKKIVINRPGVARAVLQSASSLIHSFSQSVSEPFPPTALLRCHAQTVRAGSSIYKIDFVSGGGEVGAGDGGSGGGGGDSLCKGGSCNSFRS